MTKKIIIITPSQKRAIFLTEGKSAGAQAPFGTYLCYLCMLITVRERETQHWANICLATGKAARVARSLILHFDPETKQGCAHEND